jgi:NitT/TauT family transport system permease protein
VRGAASGPLALRPVIEKDEFLERHLTPTLARAGAERQGERALRVLSPLALLALWEGLVRAHVLDARFFPAPSAIAASFAEFAGSGALASNLGITLERILAGLLLGGVPGVAIGLLIGINRWARALLEPLVALLYPIPKIALIPLVLLIFGLGEAGKYALIAIGVFFIMVINTEAGVRQIEPALLEAARAFRLRTRALYARVLLPAALPNVFAGLKLSIGIAIVLAVAAELRAANSGLGFVIWNSWETLQVERMYAALVVVSLLGYALSLAGDALERLALPWRGK